MRDPTLPPTRTERRALRPKLPPPPPPARELVLEGRAFLEYGGRRVPSERVSAALATHILPERLARMEAVLDARVTQVALGVENLHHTYNGAACVRTAEAMGLQDLVTVESENPYPLYDEAAAPHDMADARRITRQTDRWVSMHRLPDTAALRAFADARGMEVWGAAPLGTRALTELPDDRPVMVLFGNESTGLLPETMAACDGTFRIPMHGFVESFNISVSVGIVLHDLVRRVRARGTVGLDPVRRAAIHALWVYQDVRAADLILARALADD